MLQLPPKVFAAFCQILSFFTYTLEGEEAVAGSLSYKCVFSDPTSGPMVGAPVNLAKFLCE